jgi:hypothetical protein
LVAPFGGAGNREGFMRETFWYCQESPSFQPGNAM